MNQRIAKKLKLNLEWNQNDKNYWAVLEILIQAALSPFSH